MDCTSLAIDHVGDGTIRQFRSFVFRKIKRGARPIEMVPQLSMRGAVDRLMFGVIVGFDRCARNSFERRFHQCRKPLFVLLAKDFSVKIR